MALSPLQNLRPYRNSAMWSVRWGQQGLHSRLSPSHVGCNMQVRTSMVWQEVLPCLQGFYSVLTLKSLTH